MTRGDDALSRRLARRRVLVLDGALATELERGGADLDHPLWSARLVLEDPERIRRVHRTWLELGCDVIESASYQASVPGFEAAGLSGADAEEALRRSIRLAAEERDAFAAERGLEPEEAPLVAVSLGPYGAFLADGSEYRGDYAASPEEVARFHAARLAVVADEVRAGHGDLVACETVPSVPEARLLAQGLAAEGLTGWISFACRDGGHTGEGQPIEEAARALAEAGAVVALGVNCTAPRFVPELLERLARTTDRPLVAYPNRGESYDAATKRWGPGDGDGLDPAAWVRAGARVVGGCCRTTPEEIAGLVGLRAEIGPPGR